MSEFKPGLEGVVAFETEIAEPDRDGGALRYRGVDIEELVGRVPFEKVWGLLVDDAPEPGPRSRRPATRRATSRATRRPTSRPSPRTSRASGGSSKLIDISDDEARDDLARLSATMISVVAQSARLADGETTAGRPRARRTGATAADPLPARVARRGRPEARPGDRHVLDLHRRARAQRLDVRRPGRRLDRRRLRRRALVGGRRALRPAPRRRAGARAADARRRRGRRLDRATTSRTCSTRGDRLMGFGHRVYRAEDPRSRLLRGTAMDLGSPRFEVAEELERAALAELHAAQARPRPRDERRVLVGGRARRRRRAAAARARRCSRARARPAGRRTSSSRSGSAASCARRRATSAPARARSPAA